MSQDQSLLALPQDAIIGFYQAVNERNYTDAFNIIHPRFQNGPWEGDINNFINGYTHTHGIENVSTFPMDVTGTDKHFGVYYTEKLDILRDPLLDNIKTVTYQDRKQAEKNIIAFNNKMKSLGGTAKKIKKIPYRLYFSENAVAACAWLAGVDFSKNDNVFERTPGQLHEFRRAVMTETDAGWKINGLRYR